MLHNFEIGDGSVEVTHLQYEDDAFNFQPWLRKLCSRVVACVVLVLDGLRVIPKSLENLYYRDKYGLARGK